MKALWTPCALLAALLAAGLCNSAVMSVGAQRWSAQVEAAETLAVDGDWDGALSVLGAGYADWSRSQTYLHIVTQHGAVDDAEAMYHRLAAFARTGETAEFRAEAADLIQQLRLLAEMEQFSVKNVL